MRIHSKHVALSLGCAAIFMLGMFWFFVPVSHALVEGGVSSAILLKDTNNNGKIDLITLNIANGNADTWSLDGAAPYGFSVTQSGQAIDISSVALSTPANATTVGININLSEADGDLLVSTDGVNEAIMELIYTQVGGGGACANCVKDTDDELNAIATGDTGGTDIEADNAFPVVSAVAVTTNAITGITYNALQITYTENIKISTDAGGDNDIAQGQSGLSTATAGGMADTAKIINGFGQYDGLSDCRQNLNNSNTIASVDSGLNTIVTISFNTVASATAKWESTCTIGPANADAFTPTSDANDIRDFSALNNPVNATAKTMTESNAWDVTKPTIANTYSCDLDGDGDIEAFQINFGVADNMLDAGTTASSFEGDDDTSNDGSSEEAASSYNTATGGCDGAADDADVNDNKLRIGLTAGISGTETAYVNVISTTAARDWAGNSLAVGSNLGTEADKAKPVFMSASPASGGTATRSSSVTMTMSETVASATATTNTGVTLTCTVASTVITCAPTGSFIVGSNTITLATAPDAALNALNGTSVATNPYTVVFTGSNSSTSSASSSSETYSLDITAPVADASVAPGSSLQMSWTSSGSAMSVVDVIYSYDGISYTTVADNVTNNGSYTFTVPSESGDLTLSLVGSDLVTSLATDTVTVAVAATSTSDEVDNAVTAPTSGNTGLSPITGEEEDISVVNVGDYIKSPYFSTVYYVDTGSVRRPFTDAQTFMTYQDDFDNVAIVTDATLPTLTLGSPMLPKAGVTLVKIQSDAKVYFVEENTNGEMELRWITSETVASEMFGASWADYVIDVNVTLFPRYEMGDDIDEALTVEMDAMKTRAEVSG